MYKFIFILMFVLSASFLQAATVVEEIYARVGNEIITKSDYESAVQRLHDELSHRFSGEELDKKFEEQKKGLLNLLIDMKLMEQKARDLDLSVDDEVTAAIKRLRDENGIADDAALEQALRNEGSSMAQLREDFRHRIIQQKILWNYVQGKVQITEDEIKNYYEQHKSEMATTPITKVRRYRIAGEGVEKGVLNAEARSLFNTLKSGAEVTKENFPHLEMSEPVEVDSSEIDPKVAKMLDETKVGGYTEPVESPLGWILLKVEERQESKPVSLEEARGKIYNYLLQQRAEKYEKSFMDDLRKQSYIVLVKQPAS